MKERFAGKVAIVTGAGSGIGAAIAQALAAEGASVLVCDVVEDRVKATVQAIADTGGLAAPSVGDVSDPDYATDCVRLAQQQLGGLHLAVNNAGISGGHDLVADTDVATWRKLIDVDLSGVFFGVRAQIPALLAAGGGAIVNMSSVLGLVGRPTGVPYIAAKHGVAGVTKAAGVAYADRGVRVNSVHPGYIDTPLIGAANRDELVARHPIGRLGTPEEVVGVVLFLLSDNASFVVASQWTVDGGYTAL